VKIHAVKKIFLKAFMFLAFVCLSSFDYSSMLNHAMPLLPNRTLDNKTIDENYYKGHVTIVSFMFIGCMPCMNEISVLNTLKEEYAGNNKFQILCVARQMGQQMKQFNEDTGSIMGKVRKALKVDPISYSIQPACNDAESKMVDNGNDADRHIELKSECNTIAEKYGVTAFPTIFYVDKNRTIRKIEVGGPQVKNDLAFHDKIKRTVDSLLSE
jgi:thiol-disulfide isomerase/thioredoxin